MPHFSRVLAIKMSSSHPAQTAALCMLLLPFTHSDKQSVELLAKWGVTFLLHPLAILQTPAAAVLAAAGCGCARCIYNHRPHKLYTHLRLCLRAAQHCCFHPPGCQCCNLVLHQRDKGRHNNTRPPCKHSSGNQWQSVGLRLPVGTHMRHKGFLVCWQVQVSGEHTLLLCRVDGGVTGSCCH
jgi:hypothetical protein